MIEQELKQMILEMFDLKDTPNDEVNFKSLGLDSLDTMELILAIEEKYNINIPDHELTTITNFRELTWWVNHYISKSKENTNV